MKKLLTVIFVLAFVFVLSACNNDSGKANEQSKTQSNSQSDTVNSDANNTTESKTETITRDRAIELALNHAGLAKSDVRDLEAELDRERGGTYWEIDFESGNLEYSYDINAQTEEIRKIEKERD